MTAKSQPAPGKPSRHRPAAVFGLAAAKARLSELVAKAQIQGPQQITYRGRPAAYIVSAEEWERRTKAKGSLLDFFRNSPLYGSGIELERPTEPSPRAIEL